MFSFHLSSRNWIMDPWLWAILLLVLAVGIGFLELFVPSGGLLGVLAVLALVGSIVFGFIQDPIFGGIYLVLLVIGVPLLIREMVKLWPETPIGKMILLDPANDPALEKDQELEQYQKLLGQHGIVRSPMMPSGLIEINGRRYDALSEGIPLDPGTPIVVIHVQGYVITVRSRSQASQSVPSLTLEDEEPKVEDPFV